MDGARYKCGECAVRDCLLNQHLSKSWLKTANANRFFNIYSPRQTFIFEQSLSAGVYIVCRGAAKVHISGLQGREQVIQFVTQGGVLGYTGNKNSLYPYSATTIEKSSITYFDSEIFNGILKSNYELTMRFMNRNVDLLTKLQQRHVNMTQMSVKQKIVHAILEICEAVGKSSNDEVVIDIPLSRKDIAEIAGTNHEQVVRILSGLRQESIIEAGRKNFHVLDVKKLHSQLSIVA